ncbi:MAG: small basic protein [Lentisphaeria bacterium]
MSIHPSLKTKGAVTEKRNVMKRYERVNQLKKEGRYKDGERVWGLPKTKSEE